MEHISLDENGIIVSDLKSKLKVSHPKFLYGIPNFQNPTGISYCETIRKELAEVLLSEKIIFIEDDPYSEIYFDKPPSTPVSFFMPQQCIFTGSFSKMISPGIRTGWMVVPEKIRPFLLKAKQAADLHTNNVVQHLIYEFVMNNNINTHLEKIRSNYLEQKNSMLEEIKKHFPEGAKTTNPKGGMFLWSTLPECYDTADLVNYALKEKVLFVPGKTFYVNNGGNNSMRLNFTNSNTNDIKIGINRMANAMNSYLMNKKVTA